MEQSEPPIIIPKEMEIYEQLGKESKIIVLKKLSEIKENTHTQMKSGNNISAK